MPNGLSIQSKIAKALAKVNATSRVVSLRSVSANGGNTLLGLGQVVSNSDTTVDPQPAVDMISAKEIADSGGFMQMGDYQLTFAGSIEEATWKTNLILYGTEVLKVVRYEPSVIGGVVVAWSVVARAIKP